MRLATAAMIVAGLLAPRGAAALPLQVDSISYERTPCFGFCPVYKVVVNADGSGLFEGRDHVAQRGQRRFRISRAQYAAFARHLAPVRPVRGHIRYGSDNRCRGGGLPPTDGASTIVTWGVSGRTKQSLHFYSGCPQRGLSARLNEAPRMLPIAAWIAPAPLPSRR